jgi:methionine aminopeptidase
METNSRTGAIGAILDEYEKSIRELKGVIEDITENELATIVDPDTNDPNCSSVATILTHVVRSGYSYAINIRNLKNTDLPFREKILRNTISAYNLDLDDVFNFTVETFANIDNKEMEEFDNSKKILSRWGQVYDIEQMMEHAIVHILRHRRQIEKFKVKLRAAN